ncbi:globin domain-containing protein [Streptomyces caatingaensis]|uniref:nitric oxide dioxygenase n=1 Tax=Streptomyces caatingaensis TaxID=1678637 RepID=A0A0K9XC83_9ACTN|nr:globin domain-containing protein [Streptomyces caatingaensis]KNB50808.1 flavohemoprotein [Streptomyces caatingaensis]
MNTVGDEYHGLLARHDAMRLRRSLLSPGQPERPAAPVRAPYDGRADQQLILRGLDLVSPFDGLIAELYAELFARHPYLRALFPESMEFQRRHLAHIFHYLIEHLHDPDHVTATFTRLGRDHRKLGVRPAHYEAFEEALREALRRTAGSRWTGALEGAWLRMLRFAVAAMVEGAEAALGEPAAWQAEVTGHERRRRDLAVLRVRTGEPYSCRAGQYAAVQSPLLPQAWRYYSFAGAPRPDGELEFHVRLAGRGGVSEALVERTRAGDTLRLGPASGTMTLDEELPRDLLLVAGDTGWAPLKALLEEMTARRPGPRSVHLFLGARRFADLYDADAATELALRRPWLRVVPLIEDEPGPRCWESVAGAVLRHGDWSRHTAYLAGPPALVATAAAGLTAAGLPAGRVRHDPLPAAPDRARVGS